MKPRSRQQRAMMAKPTRRQVQAALLAQAPTDWQPPARDKTRRAAVKDDAVLTNLAGEIIEDDAESL